MSRRPRTRERGAAMVEAVLVIAIMVVFLGLTMYTFHSYETKLDQQTTTRSNALTVASHHCEGESGGATAPTGNELSGDASGIASRMGGGSQSFGVMTTVSKTGSATVSGSAVLDRRRQAMSRAISSYSEVVCSPKPESWGDMFSGGLGSLMGMVGFDW